MSHLPRVFVLWLRRSIGSPASSAAPRSLRRRVLTMAYGEALHPAPRLYAPPPQSSMRLSAIALGLAIAAAAGLRGPTRPGPPAFARQAPEPATVVSSVYGAHAFLRRFGARAELTVSGLPEPPIDDTYELWLERLTGPPRLTNALFAPTRAGDGTVDVPGGLRGLREVLVTSEPLGGSSSPTGPTVLRLVLLPRA